MPDKEMLKLIAQAAAGNVAFTSSQFQTARKLADFSKACKDLAEPTEQADLGRHDEPIDNGDGTVTTWAPVTVPRVWLEAGSKVVRVGRAKQGDVFFSPASGGFIRAGVDHCMDEVRVILSAQHAPVAPPAPQFREGGFYRTREGELRGPLRKPKAAPHAWTDGGMAWLIDGRAYVELQYHECDLLPGEVTVWEKPPFSLPAGEWLVSGDLISGVDSSLRLSASIYADFVSPPKPGRYKVPGGGELATWEGDA